MLSSSKIPRMALGVLVFAFACEGESDQAKSVSAPTAVSAAPRVRDAGGEADTQVGSSPLRVFAKDFVVHVRAAASRDAEKLGYLRAGATTKTKRGKADGNERCRGGWYEIESGGFVCNVADVTLFEGEKLPDWRTKQPDFDADLPYAFAYARLNGAMVFGKMPTAEQREFYERGGIIDAGIPEAGVDGGLSHREKRVSLEALSEGTDRILKRRMNRGFFVSLDREVKYGPYTYWRTQHHEYIPTEALGEIEGSEFHGVQLGDKLRLPVAIVIGSNVRAERRASVVDAGVDAAPERIRSKTGKLEKLERRTFWSVTEVREERGRAYIVSGELWVPRKQVVLVEAIERPKQISPAHKWIAVNLTDQTLVAYEGDVPVYVTLVSSGRVRSKTVESRNHPTPPGVFQISSKHVSHVMDGDSAIDGPYSIEDVPYVMYFQGAFAFHSAFWHNRFGRPKSHGCVNLAPKDAKHLFGWADPTLPESWHGVYTRDAKTTWVYIYGETPRG